MAGEVAAGPFRRCGHIGVRSRAVVVDAEPTEAREVRETRGCLGRCEHVQEVNELALAQLVFHDVEPVVPFGICGGKDLRLGIVEVGCETCALVVPAVQVR